MLIKKSNGQATRTRLGGAIAALAGTTMDRRAFLKRSGLTVGGIAAVQFAILSPGLNLAATDFVVI